MRGKRRSGFARVQDNAPELKFTIEDARTLPSMLLLSLPSLQPTAAPSCPAAATIRWVDEMVIGLNLCPWATRDSSKGFKLLETDDGSTRLDTIALEAANLASRAHATRYGRRRCSSSMIQRSTT